MQTQNKKTKQGTRAHKTLDSAPLLSEPSPELHDNSEANIGIARDEVGGLVLEELLGTGGMGEVYKASKDGFENKLAVKILKSSLLKDESSRKRFEQEAQACSMLTSPHLVSVLGYGIASEGEPYIIMDYIEGESLAHFLAREKHLEQTAFTSVFTQVCDALVHSHGKQIIHRDLKPSNIMMTSLESGGFLIRVVDFGIARLLPSPETEAQKLTQTGELLGSPIYMSPEQCTGQPLDCRSDIYSLGCVMYEALTHKPPFLGDNVVKTILMHLNDAPMKFDDVLPQNTISPEIEAIVMKCLAKLPSERYQSADELKEALESVDLHTSDARKQILKNKQNKRRLRQYLHCHERKLHFAAATSLIAIISAFMFCSSRFDEDLYNKKVDAARLVEEQVRNVPGDIQLVDTAIQTWRECISLAEKAQTSFE